MNEEIRIAKTSPPPDRHLSLDVIRGVAVMGILLANMPGFALPVGAYERPFPWGGANPVGLLAWLATFVLIEGKMRGLFSLLFGASALLVMDRAEAAGENPAIVHFSRMAVLLAIGLLHLYLVWWGDILAHYALVGAILFPFRRLGAAQLLSAGLSVLVLSGLWALAQGYGPPPLAEALAETSAMRGSWAEQVAYRWHHGFDPLTALLALGPETLAAMLLGMAAYRSGLLGGEFPRAAYRRWALAGLGIALPAYLTLGLSMTATRFAPASSHVAQHVLTIPFRLLGAIGYAALIIVLMRRGGWLTERLAAVGRAAFTNYLGTSLIVTGLFYGWGLGLFGRLGRAELYLVPPLVWALMLLWSKPWLDRFHYGPFEWFWRSLARGRAQPMRRLAA